MAAAALTELSGGSARQAASAASMAMQNLIGLVCDPVADRVEVPCLGKNISAAMNALSSHIMAMSGFNQVIPLNEVIDTVEAVGNLLPPALRCTGKGGLAVTPASVRIKGMLKCLK
jgi:L-serine dehydratase